MKKMQFGYTKKPCINTDRLLCPLRFSSILFPGLIHFRPVITHLLTAYSRIVVRSCHSLKSPHPSRTQHTGVTRSRLIGVESAASHPSARNAAQKERRHEGASPDRSS